MSKYNMVVSTPETTVVSSYEPISSKSDSYQSEAALEKRFIEMLQEQGYEYLTIHNSEALENNLRKCLGELNDYTFSDDEWQSFFKNNIASKNEGIAEKSQKIQDDYIQCLTRDDGTTKNIKLIDKDNIHNNKLQVINQYATDGGNYSNRYDVTILVNGLPMIHVELKRRGVPIREAFNQIERYQRDSFWADSGLFEYVQIFVISNGTHTKYYSNTTRSSAIKERESSRGSTNKKSHSFEFTSYWSDAQNNIIPDLVDFTRTFFQKHTILNILTKYTIFTSEKILLVMRPYQIVATESILNSIKIATNYKKAGTIDAGGYVWHTTGSGKTLTSFKAAQLASRMPEIKKVLFVVDRKDLDYQTVKEYDRFAKGAANGSNSTNVLTRQLSDKDENGNYHEYPIIVTTIQKLDKFIQKNPDHPIYDENVVIIFDECHRSQFGDMHKRIVNNFKKYFIFGFTGTPIFLANSSSNTSNPLVKTTEQLFGDKLHVYTIVDAINDGNVLPFKVDYVRTIKEVDEDVVAPDALTDSINKDEILNAPERIENVTRYILEHFNQKTKRNSGHYSFNKLTNIKDIASGATKKENRVKTQMNGFNSIFAVSSIEAAKLYYDEFQKQMDADPTKRIKIATVFSYAANEDVYAVEGELFEENPESAEKLPESSREFLDRAIDDYNKTFNTAYDTSSQLFSNYYKDLSQRMKNREVDLLIVVNMFLTGFDAPTLNTLWVDKNMHHHGLIQAFSRTNRILNSVKNHGNIVCFRNLENELNDALSLFGNRDAKDIVVLKTFDDYYYGSSDGGLDELGYFHLVNLLRNKYPLGERIIGEDAQKDFIRIFGNILKLRNILDSFDEFEGMEIFTPREFQDYTSIYIDLYNDFKEMKDGGEGAADTFVDGTDADSVIFEIELVKQIEVNIDYIVNLIVEYSQDAYDDEEFRSRIQSAIQSSPTLRNQRELIEKFIEVVNPSSDVVEEWTEFIINEKAEDVKELIKSEKLNEEKAYIYVDNIFRTGEVKRGGTDIDQVMPPISRFAASSDNSRRETKDRITSKFEHLYRKYDGLGIDEISVNPKDNQQS